MRPSKAADRSMQKLAAMLAQHGFDQQVIEEVKETAPTDRMAISRQGEAVLAFLETPAKFTTKICKREACQQPFGTNYRSVAYCSDNCRSRAVSEMMGVKWDWTRATEEERWGGEPPLIIPPAALQKIQKYVEFFLDTRPTQTRTENLPESTIQYLDRTDRLVQLVPQAKELQLSSVNSNGEAKESARTSPPESPQQLVPELTQEIDEQASPFDF